MDKRFKKFRDRVFDVRRDFIHDEVKKELDSVIKIPYIYTLKFESGSETDYHQQMYASIMNKETKNAIARISFKIEKQPHCCSAGTLSGLFFFQNSNSKDSRYILLLIFFDALVKTNENFATYIGFKNSGQLIKDIGGHALATPANKKILSVHSKDYAYSDISLYSLQIKGRLYKQDYKYSGVRSHLAKRESKW